MKYTWNKKGKFVILATLVATILCISFCLSNLKRSSWKIERQDEIFEKSDTVYRVSAFSETSLNAGQIWKNIIIENLDEPIEVTFWQTGRNRKVLLQIYLDYQTIEFSVGDKLNYDEKFIFEIDENEEKDLKIFLSPNIKEDELSHRLIFNFIPSYDEHAKDKSSANYNTTASYMYQLHFGEMKNEIKYSDKCLNQKEEVKYYPYRSIPLMLNTDISTVEKKRFEGVKLPERNYLVQAGSKFYINYIISNIEPCAETAILFVTVGNQTTLVNEQEYILVDLQKDSMSIGECSFLAPTEIGMYDVIGYVVYDPFIPMENDARSFVSSSVRFTIEVG